jgi:hypothetical protein
LPACAAAQKLVRSYWWLAWSVLPIMAVDVGGRWWGVGGRGVVLERLVLHDLVTNKAFDEMEDEWLRDSKIHV